MHLASPRQIPAPAAIELCFLKVTPVKDFVTALPIVMRTLEALGRTAKEPLGSRKAFPLIALWPLIRGPLLPSRLRVDGRAKSRFTQPVQISDPSMAMCI
jgi:hypothetical protein